MNKQLFLVFLISVLYVFVLPQLIQTSAQTPSPAVVPGEIIVKYKNGDSPGDLKTATQDRTEKKQTFFGSLQVNVENATLRLKGEKTPEEKLADEKKVDSSLQVAQIKQLAPTAQENSVGNIDDIHLVKTNSTQSVRQLEDAYKKLPEVEYAEPNYLIFPQDTPNDTYYPQMWGLSKIHMNEAWNITHGSHNVIVAVIDTGIDYTHVDLPTDIIRGHDYSQNDDDPMDDGGHGTHVAGTIGALTNDSVGISGINWQVQLMAVKVLKGAGSGTSTFVNANQGIIYATDHGAKVINMSLGGVTPCSATRSTQDAINYAVSHGVTVVVAAGNNNHDTNLDSPSSCDNIINVGATGPNDERASYSNYGAKVTIAAPGGNPFPHGSWECNSFDTCAQKSIASTWPYSIPVPCDSSGCEGYKDTSNSFGVIQGTSMATPHVAGLVALMLSVNPNLTSDQVKTILQNTGDTITTDRPIGKRINAYQALLAAAPIATAIPPTDTPTPMAGDINGDRVVNVQDFEIWRCEFVGNGVCASPHSDHASDLDHNTIVDLADFIIWRNAFTP